MFYKLMNRYARFRLRHPVYVFHHVPKCGGTSVRIVLNSWFHTYNDYYEPDEPPIPPVDLKYLNSQKCLCGHFGHQDYRLDERYPQIFGSSKARKHFRVFSFLRDPLEMRCSLFRHKKAIRTENDETLAQGIMPLNNYYARIIGVNETDYQQKLDAYFFIGVQEELQSSFDTLASLIRKPKIQLPTENKSETDRKNSVEHLTPREIAQFKQANHLDYQIYDYAKRRLDELRTNSNRFSLWR